MGTPVASELPQRGVLLLFLVGVFLFTPVGSLVNPAFEHGFHAIHNSWMMLSDVMAF